jgi:uncharacterized protein YdhG (YjbR/CyaY superfamily)
MSKAKLDSVDEYIAQKPETTQGVLRCVRDAIRRSLPRAEEGMSYAIPTYKLDGRAVLYFAGWKEHFSIYPATPKVVSEFGNELAPYAVKKGTIRFPLSEPVPVSLIEGIAKLRASEVDPAGGETAVRPKATSRR